MNPYVHNHVQNPYANALCVLKVDVKCEECKLKLMNVLSSICGVYSVNIDAEKGLAEIGGQVDPNHLLQEVSRSGQHAELVRVRLQHPAAGRGYSSCSSSNGYGRTLLNDRTYGYGLSYALPEANNYINSSYYTNDYAYSSGARYVPSRVLPEYNPYEDETFNCTIL